MACLCLSLVGCSDFSEVRDSPMKSGAAYSGRLKADRFARPDGEGTMVYPDGSRYQGDWARGVCEGTGHFQSPDGSDYRGTFKNDRPSKVVGIMRFKNVWYRGTWDYSACRGSGTITWPEGQWYCGDWINPADGPPIPEGDGELHYAEGSVYAGRFYNALPDGYGSLRNTEGKTVSGIFKHGAFVRKVQE